MIAHGYAEEVDLQAELVSAKERIRSAIYNNMIGLESDQMAKPFLHQVDLRLNQITEYNNLPFKLLEQIGLNDITPSTPIMAGRSMGLNCQENCDVPMSLAGIWGYGCWCNFGANLMEGSGTPMNGHDIICQKMQLCLRCAKLDTQGEGDSCDPKTKSYNAEFGFGNQSMDAQCLNQNQNDMCATRVCTCEMKLIADLVDYIFTGQGYDPSYRHESLGGNFDQNLACPIGRSLDSAPADPICCGRYPDRVPFSSNSAKDCCLASDQLYSVVHQKCCDSGVVEVGDACV